MGTGVGLRLDVSFFVVRLDVAFPIRKPWNAEGDRWVFDKIAFGSSDWVKENLVYNIAIGYPFKRRILNLAFIFQLNFCCVAHLCLLYVARQ